MNTKNQCAVTTTLIKSVSGIFGGRSFLIGYLGGKKLLSSPFFYAGSFVGGFVFLPS